VFLGTAFAYLRLADKTGDSENKFIGLYAAMKKQTKTLLT